MHEKPLLIICIISSLISSIVVSFLMTRSIYRIHHQPIAVACISESIYLQPLLKTISIGKSFEASIIITACGYKISKNITWVSENSNIATVDARTGLVTAIANGETIIRPTNEYYSSLDGITANMFAQTGLASAKEVQYHLGKIKVTVTE